jgi:hypothetical protein
VLSLKAKLKERRKSQRQMINRVAKIQSGNGSLPRDCIVTDISDGGVRLHVEGSEVPDQFVLLLSGEAGELHPRDCQVVWRLGHEIGAEFARLSATAG